MPRTQYVKSEGVSLAYQTAGEGELTLLHVPGAISNFALEDLAAPMARYFERISRFCRLVRFDKRGTGLSDRSGTPLALEDQMSDVEAVRKAVGAERVALYGLSQGAAVAVLYALQHPERVSHLILVEGVCCDASDQYRPMSETNRLVDWGDFFAELESDFEAFSHRMASIMSPGVDDEGREGMTQFLRATASPATFESLWRGIVGLDLRPVLKRLEVKTLVVHTTGDRHHPVAHGRYFAEHIPDARMLELDSELHVPYMAEEVGDQIVPVIEEFLTGTVRHSADRHFAAVLFTDIVDSTGEQRRRGDRAWQGILESHEADARRFAEQFGGKVVEVQGDGVMTTFPTAGEALRAASALRAAADDLGIQIRAGLQAGEVYQVGARLFGICVTVAARVAAQAGAGDILSTEVVRGLVEGSGLSFTDAGEFDLKGIGVRRLVRLT